MTRILILPMQAGHVDGCARIVATTPLWSERYGIDYSAARTRFRSGMVEAASLYVAQRKVEVVGFVWLSLRGAFTRSGYICLLGVRSDFQGCGVGTKLMDFAEELLFADDDNVFLLVSGFNESAQRFYRNRGYEKVGMLADYVRPGIDEFIFQKRRSR